MLPVISLIAIKPSVIRLSVAQSVIRLSVIMLSVIILRLIAPSSTMMTEHLVFDPGPWQPF